MMAGDVIRPLRGAIGLALRPPSLVAWLVVLSMATGLRAFRTRPNIDIEPLASIWLGLLMFVGPALISAIIIFALSRTLLDDAAGYGRPLYGRFVGLYVLAVIVVEFLSFAGTIAVFSSGPSETLLVYGSPFVGSLASIAVFPLFVRCFATAAGIEEPRLGSVWSFVFDQGKWVYFWYAVCSFGFNLLGPFTFVNLLPAGEGNDLPGNLIQSAIAATAQILRSMLDIVAVKMVATGRQEDVEVFA
jgi:hypothetical protein